MILSLDYKERFWLPISRELRACLSTSQEPPYIVAGFLGLQDTPGSTRSRSPTLSPLGPSCLPSLEASILHTKPDSVTWPSLVSPSQVWSSLAGTRPSGRVF